MNYRIPRPLVLAQLAIGLMDALTGILLISAPLFTLRLMRIGQVPESGIFVSFVGAFVLGVGLTYLPLAIRAFSGRGDPQTWETQWQGTAIIRACVAVLLVVQVASGRMGIAWVSVIFTDGGLALLQWIGARRGWLRFHNLTSRPETN